MEAAITLPKCSTAFTMHAVHLLVVLIAASPWSLSVKPHSVVTLQTTLPANSHLSASASTSISMGARPPFQYYLQTSISPLSEMSPQVRYSNLAIPPFPCTSPYLNPSASSHSTIHLQLDFSFPTCSLRSSLLFRIGTSGTEMRSCIILQHMQGSFKNAQIINYFT